MDKWKRVATVAGVLCGFSAATLPLRTGATLQERIAYDCTEQFIDPEPEQVEECHAQLRKWKAALRDPAHRVEVEAADHGRFWLGWLLGFVVIGFATWLLTGARLPVATNEPQPLP